MATANTERCHAPHAPGSCTYRLNLLERKNMLANTPFHRVKFKLTLVASIKRSMGLQGYLISIFIKYILSGADDINEGVPRKLQRRLQCPLCLHKIQSASTRCSPAPACCWQACQPVVLNTNGSYSEAICGTSMVRLTCNTEDSCVSCSSFRS